MWGLEAQEWAALLRAAKAGLNAKGASLFCKETVVGSIPTSSTLIQG